MRNSKNRYFYHFFVSPGDAPGAITLNVVWMEREFHACKLSRCMCPSNYNRFWDRARYLWKNRHFIIPLAFDAPVRGVPVGISAPPLVWKKNRMVSLPEGLKISQICLFVLTWSTNVTDGPTDRQTDRQTLRDSIDRACIASRGKNVVKIAIFGLTHWLKHRITRKLLKIDRYMLRVVWQALNWSV